MEILIKAAQLVLSLSILVIFHEFGHFIAAKIFKTRVEKFYLFFNPWFSLFKFKFGETEYGMGWLPLGGYVKISGMIDESMDKEQMKQPPQPYEFRSKPAWQRLIIMLGGVIVNILLAIGIYIIMLFSWGEQYLPTSEVKYGITADSLACEMGLRNGDQILSIDNVPVEDFHKIPSQIIIEEAKSIQVMRNGKSENITIPDGFLNKLIHHRSTEFIGIRYPFIAGAFTSDSPARLAGIEVSDQIIGINDKPTFFFDEFREEIRKFKGEQVTISVIRDGDTLEKPVQVASEGVIGVYPQNPAQFFNFKEKNYSLLAAIPAGASKAFEGVSSYLKQMRLLFSKEVKAYESIGGFITIGSIFPSTWNWQAFWGLTAFLSIMLAILNVLPIPALDGGHVMFLLYEIIARRKPSDKFLEYSQIVGMVILFGLLIFANGNDILRLFASK
ncbi:MAG: RIP metalloprotease RseP [Sphingobacteriia bacterium]|nr:RIP metalloprotease RseP [Sphingobacteriia bacterium]